MRAGDEGGQEVSKDQVMRLRWWWWEGRGGVAGAEKAFEGL